MNIFLTQEELIELTGRRRRDSQLRALRFMGLEHKVRPDGSLAVLRSHVEKEFDGGATGDKNSPRVEPNWAAI